MAGVEKTWAGRVMLGMKVVIMEWRVIVDMMVDVLMVRGVLHTSLTLNQLAVTYIS